MQISAVEQFHVRIPFKGSFKHALKERREADAIILAVRTASGETGWGEIVPREYLTGETIESVYREHVPARAKRVLGLSLGSVREWITNELESAGRLLATFSGFELALWDLLGQTEKKPAWSYFASELGPELPAGVVIGFEVATEQLPKQCAMLRMSRKKHVKVKVGLDDDLARLAIISKALGPDLPLRLDANEAWTVSEAIDRLNAMKSFRIESIEQPIAAKNLSGMREIREKTGVRVMADESLCTVEDAHRLIAEKAADVFNVRVGKCGGLLGSTRIVEIARQHGLGCHLGALVGETGILSMAAELFGRTVDVFDCLEGKGQHKFLLSDDVTEARDGGFGLGVYVDRAKLEKYLVARDQIAVPTEP